MGRVEREFEQAREEAAAVFPRAFSVGLVLDWAAGRTGRAFAYCDYGAETYIACSPRLALEPVTRVRGIIRHEFGHAIDSLYSRSTIEQRIGPVHGAGWAELMADDIAAGIWGVPMRYDADHVQTTGPGTSPRPRHLPR